jgi:site-specific recombinase XerD
MAKKPATNNDDVLAAFASHLRLMENRTPQTVGTYTAHARTFSRYLGEVHCGLSLTEVESQHIHLFLLHEGERGLSQGTRTIAYFALKALYSFLLAIGEVTVNPVIAVVVRHTQHLRTEVYTDAEAEQILSWVSKQEKPRWVVGHVVLSTLRFTGLRLTELVTLNLSQMDLGARRISVIGKGRKPRMIPVPPALVPVLGAYLEDIRPALTPSPYLFVNPGSHQANERRFGPMPLYKLVRQAGERAGVPGRHFPHRWRHTYATSLLRHGEDIHVVQRLLGHSNIATTARYLHLSDADLMAAVDRAFPAS